MPVPVYRVTDAAGATVAEYVASAASGGTGWLRALRHAALVGGKVFYIDQHGFLSLVHGARSSQPGRAA